MRVTRPRAESFVVTVGAYGGPAQTATINFRPFANPTTGTVAENTPGQVQLNGTERLPRYLDAQHAHLRAAQSARARHDQRLQRVDRHVHVHAGPGISRGGYALVPGDGNRARNDTRDHGEQPGHRDDRGGRGPRPEPFR